MGLYMFQEYMSPYNTTHCSYLIYRNVELKLSLAPGIICTPKLVPECSCFGAGNIRAISASLLQGINGTAIAFNFGVMSHYAANMVFPFPLI